MIEFTAENVRKLQREKLIDKDLDIISGRIHENLGTGETCINYYCDGTKFKLLSEELVSRGFIVEDINEEKPSYKKGYKTMRISW